MEPLTVNYTLSGAASNASDYSNLSGTVIIPQMASGIDMTAITELLMEGPETVTLTPAVSIDYQIQTSTALAFDSWTDNDKLSIFTTHQKYRKSALCANLITRCKNRMADSRNGQPYHLMILYILTRAMICKNEKPESRSRTPYSFRVFNGLKKSQIVVRGSRLTKCETLTIYKNTTSILLICFLKNKCRSCQCLV